MGNKRFDQTGQAIALLERGHTYAEVARILGYSSGTISTHVLKVRPDLTHEHQSERRRQEALALKNVGLSTKVVAKELNLSESAVNSYYREANAPETGEEESLGNHGYITSDGKTVHICVKNDIARKLLDSLEGILRNCGDFEIASGKEETVLKIEP